MKLVSYFISVLLLFPSLAPAAPDLAYLSHSVLDPLGDNDHFPEPGETFNLAVRIQNTGDDRASSILGTLVPPAPPGVTFIDDTADFPDLSPGQKTESADPHFAIGLASAVPCAEPIHLAVRFDYVDSLSQPQTQTTVFVLVVGEATVLYHDDFEFGVGGWDFDEASSTILVPDTDGRWIVANPQGTFSGGEKVQPEDDATENGLSCYYTGQNISGDPYTYDVDGGTSVLLSRPYDLQGRGDVILSYARWFYTDSPGIDQFEAQISNDDGGSWVSLERILDKQNLWTRTGFRVTDFVPLTGQMRVRFVAADYGTESLVEAAVDDVALTEYICEADPPEPALSVAAHSYTDTVDPDCTDGDNLPDGGETVDLGVTVQNTGTADAVNVLVHVSSTDPNITWVGPDSKSFGTIPNNGGTASDSFRFKVSEAASCMEPVVFDFQLTSDGPFSFVDGVAGKLETDVNLSVQKWFDDFDSGMPSWYTGLVEPTAANWWALQQEDCVYCSDTVTPALTFIYQGDTGFDTTDCSVTPYPGFHNAFVYTPPIDTGQANPYLRFLRWEHLCTLGPGDYAEIYIDLDNDGDFELLDHLEGSVTGNDDVLDPYEIDLQNNPAGLDVSNAGRLISVLFLLYSDMIGGEGPYLGWIVDNVELEWSNAGPEQCDQLDCGAPCVPPQLAADNSGPTCTGLPVTLSGSVVSPGTGNFIYTWDFGDGSPTEQTAAPGTPVQHTYGSSGSFQAVLSAVDTTDPSCASEAPTTVQVDGPPVFAASNNGPICAGQTVDLTAAVSDPGVGTYGFAWDFGDGSPVQPVSAPTDIVSHQYSGPGPAYTAVLDATHTAIAGCGSSSQTTVQIDPGADPAGAVANNLRLRKAGDDLILDWSNGPLNPRNYNVLRTQDRTELDDTPAGIGDETRIDAPVRTREQATDAASIPDGNSYFYEVWGANLCTGETVVP